MIVVERERGWVSIWACRRPSLCHCAAAVEVAATPPLRRAAAAHFSCPLYMPACGVVTATALRCPSLPSHALLCPGEKCKYIHSKLLESTAFVLVPSQYGVHHWVVGQRLNSRTIIPQPLAHLPTNQSQYSYAILTVELSWWHWLVIFALGVRKILWEYIRLFERLSKLNPGLNLLALLSEILDRSQFC